MSLLAAKIKAFWASRSGATSLEYAIIGAGLSICIIAGAQAMGVSLTGKFSAVANNFK